MSRNASSNLNFFVLLLIFLVPLYLFFYLRFHQIKASQSEIEPQELKNASETLINSTITPSTVTPAWDALDGQGYEFIRRNKLDLNADYDILSRLPPCGVEVQMAVEKQIERIKFQFMGCVPRIVEQWRGQPDQMITEWTDKAKFCDDLPELKVLDLVSFDNLQETEWAILPKCKENHTLLSLGIEHDTLAEESLNATVSDFKFFGVDPIIDPNRQLFSPLGEFFPFAIGRKSGFYKFRTLPNQNQKTRRFIEKQVLTIDLMYLLDVILKLKRIDYAWIDIEGTEFEFLHWLHRNGALDKKGISICQINLEFHPKLHPNGAKLFHDFIFRVLKEQRYVFLKSRNTDPGVHRMFFFNVENNECVSKYFNVF